MSEVSVLSEAFVNVYGFLCNFCARLRIPSHIKHAN